MALIRILTALFAAILLCALVGTSTGYTLGRSNKMAYGSRRPRMNQRMGYGSQRPRGYWKLEYETPDRYEYETPDRYEYEAPDRYEPSDLAEDMLERAGYDP
nr:P-U9 [Pinctada fucata]